MKRNVYFHFSFTILSFLLIFITSNNAFTQDLNPTQWPNLKEYWKFQDTSNLLKSTVGNNLNLIGQHQWVQGAAYKDTAVRIGIGSYYKAYHSIPPNGGGDSVNKYSLMFDFKVLNFDRWHTFHQTDTSNTNDGECFIRPNSGSEPGRIGVGYTSYSADSILPNKWYRLVISVNLDLSYDYYLNGILLHKGDTEDLFIDQRFALTPAILFFADNNQEDDTIDVSSIAIFDTCLTATQIAQLGTIEPCIANPPIVDIGKDTTLCWGKSLQVNAGSGFKEYLWSTGDTIANITIDTTNFGTGKDTLWVRIKDMNDCQTTDSIVITFTDCTQIEDNTHHKKVDIYPNPSKGKITIELLEKASSIYIFDVEGQKIKELNNLETGKYDIDLMGLAQGLYYIKIQFQTNVSMHKLLMMP